MVIGEVYYNKIVNEISEKGFSENDNITVLVSSGSLSKAVGQKKRNKIRLAEKYKNIRFAESTEISGYEISVNITDGETKCT